MELLLQKRGYFWDEFDDQARNWFNLQLFENKYVIDLQHIYGCYMSKYVPSCKEAECWLSTENREKFFTYLLPILEREELKVKVSDEVTVPVTSADIKRAPLLEGFKTQFVSRNIKEYNAKQAKEAIEDIKKRWAEVSEEDRSHFEQFGVIFTLPENEWAI